MSEANEVEVAKRKVLAVYPDAYIHEWNQQHHLGSCFYIRHGDKGPLNSSLRHSCEGSAWLDAASRLPARVEPAKPTDAEKAGSHLPETYKGFFTPYSSKAIAPIPSATDHIVDANEKVAVEHIVQVHEKVSGATGEQEYTRGFNRCKELAERIVDEHDEFLERVGLLDPVTSDIRILTAPERGEDVKLPPRPKRYSTEIGVLQNQVPGRCNTWSETSEDENGEEIDAQEFVVYADEIERQLLTALKENAQWRERFNRAHAMQTRLADRAEQAEAKLAQTYENLVIVRMQDYAELSAPDAAYKLYSLWQDALHKPHVAHPENREIAELKDENLRVNNALLAACVKENDLEAVLVRRDEKIARLNAINDRYAETLSVVYDRLERLKGE